ncbi:DUF3817 domain-containing protein [Paenibacillus sp. JX-17]|uniref:DUF3817 domain-containing protein n=1 Tax=Paenibacillus lacisoli TaxID=3064525 RepID=A0ABT9CFV8_9BACL|nr:DUF3817 domain-containing protein [Paenibacillus sp. JX-17]MDO7908164.1 DUF3817 domain-containing protein [Paenibacillus sp. JX-17]
MLKTPLGRFRLTAWVQGVTYLILLFVAMPLRDKLEMPELVTIFGNLYGIFFLLYLLVMIYARSALGWSMLRPIAAFFASFVPFGNFVMDRLWFRKWGDSGQTVRTQQAK